MTIKELESRKGLITRAIRKAVKNAIEEHWANGEPVHVKENGKLLKLYPPANFKKKK